MTRTSTDEEVDEIRVAVASVWRDSLGLEELEDEGHFFKLGGDSLAALQVIAALQERLGVALTFSDLLDAPTVDAFANLIPTLKRSTSTRLPKRRRTLPPPTRLQAARWRLRRQPVAGAEVSWLYRIEGQLNVEALAGAVDELVRRHEILRTTFGRRRGGLRQIVQSWVPGYLQILDVTDLPKRQRETAALQRLVDDDYRAFDYKGGPLIRPTLVKIDRTTNLFSLACCEMAVDGSSRRLLSTALSKLYDMLDKDEDLADYPFPAIQFGDFAFYRRSKVGRKEFFNQLSYWRERLRSVDRLVRFSDKEQPNDRQPVKVERRALQLAPSVMAKVESTARELATTPFSVLNAAFVALLSSLTGRENVVYTTTLTHRDAPRTEEVIGPFYNNVFVIVDIRQVKDGKELIGVAASAARESFKHGEVPHPQLKSFLPRPEPGSVGVDVGDIRFQLHEHPGEMRFGTLRMQPVQLPITGGPSLYIMATRTAANGLDVELFSGPDLSRQLIDGILPSYRRMLTALIENPLTPLHTLLRMGPRAYPGKAK
jgi:acyl carrier protein